MMEWCVRKKTADVYMPEVKRILGEHLIFEGTTQQDQFENTDLIVLTASQLRIGVRVRNSGYLEKYGCDFTLRSSLRSGRKTELEKILDGWGDFIFYGHGDGSRLTAWGIGKLDVLRTHIVSTRLFNDDRYPRTKPNHDGYSSFAILRWCDVGDKFIVAHSGLPL